MRARAIIVKKIIMGNTVIREKAIENVKNGTKVNKLLVPKKIVTVIIDDQI